MSNTDIDKQIAFEMTKAIIAERKQHSITSIDQHNKGITPKYWADLYKECLGEIKKGKDLNIHPEDLDRI
ncbi:hypothetical protein EXU29_12195 [Acinetobacter wuhouensis]|uniref:hypothetical protein n=1 Tax=Acinetobacter wuhouensis TaxID=1879050 RepID=UPI001023E774|nr:hypothetical protein [Acinetobacter wuhouensis]RZG71880.1 hypothetical protein EXU29_12195 [Acinetobacter wuhouensis]